MRTLQLAASAIAIYEYGDPAGEPIFFFHGWPGSGRQASILDSAARQTGWRILAPDRPGIGDSPRVPGRRITDWPALVAEMADVLALEQFGILGVSGGGPYALACAAAMPGRIRAISVVCGAPPIADLAHHGSLHVMYRLLLGVFHRRPDVVRAFFSLARPFLMWRGARAFLPPLRCILPGPDSEALGDPEAFEEVFACNRDAFNDVDGLYEDAALYAQPWGFRPEDITAPVQFWHGEEDANFHWSLARDLCARVPNAILRLVPGEGHFSLPIRQAAAILGAMRESCGAD